MKCSLIAQLVEHSAVNRRVRGSSPRQGAKGTVAQSAEAIDLKSIKYGFESHSSYQYNE